MLGLLCFCQIRVVLLDDPLALLLCFGVGFLLRGESDSWCDFGIKCMVKSRVNLLNEHKCMTTKHSSR